MPESWRLFVDTGGTFTDALARAPDGRRLKCKVLSSGSLRGSVKARVDERTFQVAHAFSAESDVLRGGAFRLLEGEQALTKVVRFDPEKGLLELDGDPGPAARPGAAFEVRTREEAPILAARLLTHTAAGDPLPSLTMRLGTTLATNALLTRSGAETALFITQGFGDLLEIGTQQRPDLFALNVQKPPPVHQHTIEVKERLGADGAVLLPLDLTSIEERVRSLLARGVRCAAVAFLHSDKNPSHEQGLAEYLAEKGFTHVSCSSDLARVIRILPRAATAVVDAVLNPVVEGYLKRIGGALAGGRLLVMTSAGGLVGASALNPKDLLLSGPAGGVVGAARAGRRSGFHKVLSFDMGGTSTDVARFDGHHDYVFEHRVGDAHLFAPALSIETVAAGGGSICSFDGTGLAVGPGSAGASPGPACYGAGGPLTMTDVNLLLGRLDPARFGIPVAAAPAREALAKVLQELAAHTGEKPRAEAVLEGFLAIANERMADAIQRISIRRGYDPVEYTLVGFGGAGGQHACSVAARLGVRTVTIPEDAGLLSACGLAGAVVERFSERQVLESLGEVEDRIPSLLEEVAREAMEELEEEGVHPDEAVVRRRIAEIRFAGQETALQVEIDEGKSLKEAFAEQYLAVYGHEPGEREIELVSLRVAASSRPPAEEAIDAAAARVEAEPEGRQRAWFHGKWMEIPVFDRDRLAKGARIEGPALVFEKHSATVVEPGWRLDVDGAGSLVLRCTSAGAKAEDTGRRPEAVQVELFSHRFESIAREMGEALRRTAVSTNVKERLDFSCALLDEDGELVVNAPHIPVHLGSMELCVQAVRKVLPLGEGDAALTNHPAFGGSHLPDLTVVAPVHFDGALLGYVAARAHHAEIGGIRPGSMPPNAKRLIEEGVVIPPFLAVRKGRARWDEVERLFLDSPWPTRAVQDNLADLKAAVAACHRGGQALRSLAEEHGRDRVGHYMAALKDRAERRIREVLGRLPDGEYAAAERLDDGTPLEVRMTIRGEEARVDFTGTAGVHPGNLNATPAIVRSTVIYVLRLMVQEDLPLNDGLMRPVELVIPGGLLDPPFPDDPARAPSIVGGNVETSQRLVDTLIKALELAAGSQGTMNNVLFGDERFSYYETVCGGCGAGQGFHGASAVHSHMTNTRITDPEVLEHRYPARLERFAIRRGSGGEGRFRGGDGVVREIAFLAPLELSILSQRRKEGPFGMEGGRPGRPGSQRVIRSDGSVLELDGIDSCRVEPGDRLLLETPGGGGFGEAKNNA